jgi:4-hydroxybenzoate polyprenyltransferase
MRLVWNHLDAWGTTFIITSTALFVHQAITPHHLLLAGAITLIYWYGFALNDYYDVASDAQDPRKRARNPFIGVATPPILWWGVGCGLVLTVTFASFSWSAVWAVPLPLVVMWAYSAPPLRLKARPGLDVLTHALFVQSFPYWICLFVLGATWSGLDRVLLTLFFCSSLAAQLEQQIRDHAFDRQHEQTFTTRISPLLADGLLRGLSALLVVSGLGAFALGWMPMIIWPYLAAALPIALHRLVRGPTAPRSERLALALAAICVGYTVLVWGAGLARWL